MSLLQQLRSIRVGQVEQIVGQMTFARTKTKLTALNEHEMGEKLKHLIAAT